MDVRVHGRNMQVSSQLQELADDRVRHAGRILDNGVVADVEFTERRNPRQGDARYRVEITSHTAGHTVRVQGEGPDDRTALDKALDKFESQLRRLKDRLVHRSRPRGNKSLNDALDTSDVPPSDEFEIVRTKRFEMRPMTPQEAALQMEMIGHSFFFFLDANTGRHCVLYHRDDGSLGLIEPQ